MRASTTSTVHRHTDRNTSRAASRATREPYLSRYLRSSLALSIGCGWLASALVLLRDVFPDGPVPRALLCLAWLIFAPLYTSDLVYAVRHRPWLGPWVAALRLVLEVTPIFLIPAPLVESIVFGGAILALAHLFLARDDVRFAAIGLASPPLIVIFALALEPSAAHLILLPVTLVCSSCAAVLLQGRTARGRVRRKGTRDEARPQILRRIGYGALLALVVLVLGLLVFAGTEAGLRTLELARAPEKRDERPLSPSPSPAAGGNRGSTPVGGSEFAPDMAFSGGAFPFGVAPVLKVRPLTDDPGGAGPVHMRDMVLDDFHAGGVSLRERTSPPLHVDGTDGDEDGWTHVAAPRPADETLQYTVLARPLTVAGVGWTLLFSPHPLVAIQYDPILYHPDQVLATPDVPTDWFEYGIRIERRNLTATELALRAATHPDPQYTQLPDDSAIEVIRAYAEPLWPGATTDFDKVVRVVRHLRDTFDYELSHTTFEGPAAIVEFLDRGSGYCTYFASAATLMLRTEGIAARLATGFLAKEFSVDESAWIAREKDAHAWMEVHFEGIGWVTFDATPVSGSSGMGGVGALDDLGGMAPLRQMVDLFQRWLATGGSDVGLGEVLLAGLRWIAGTLRSPLGFILAALVLGLLIVRGNRTGTGLLTAAGLRPRRGDLFAKLEAALARHGFQRRRGETPREFAGVVAARGGPLYAPVARAAELLYRVRFGRTELAGDERTFLTELVQSLEASESRPERE